MIHKLDTVKYNKQSFIFLLIGIYQVYSLPGLIRFVHKTWFDMRTCDGTTDCGPFLLYVQKNWIFNWHNCMGREEFHWLYGVMQGWFWAKLGLKMKISDGPPQESAQLLWPLTTASFNVLIFLVLCSVNYLEFIEWFCELFWNSQNVLQIDCASVEQKRSDTSQS
jgi:hypothetical protein